MAATAGNCFAAIFAYNSNGQLRLSALGRKLVVGAWVAQTKFDVVTAMFQTDQFSLRCVRPPCAARHAVVICVDEKPSIQALERAQGYLKLPNGRALTGHSHDYKRHGTTTLFAAFEVATGKVTGAHDFIASHPRW